jgi:hypothetical protein
MSIWLPCKLAVGNDSLVYDPLFFRIRNQNDDEDRIAINPSSGQKRPQTRPCDGRRHHHPQNDSN